MLDIRCFVIQGSGSLPEGHSGLNLTNAFFSVIKMYIRCVYDVLYMFIGGLII